MAKKRPEYLNEDSVFVRKIESDSNICSNCFRKIREHHETKHDVASSITEYEDDVDFSYFDDFVDTGRPNIHKAYCPCGAVDWNDVRVRPLDMEQMMQAGTRIVKHLMEKGYIVDEERFFEIIEEEANLPENQFREEVVFEEAVSKTTSKEETDEDDSDSSQENKVIV